METTGSVVSAHELENTGSLFTINVDPKDVIVLAEAINPCNITFHNEEGDVGTLTWKDGVMRFEGEADEAAQIFFDSVSNLWNEHYG